MVKTFRTAFISLLAILVTGQVYGQADTVEVVSIAIEGDKRTRKSVIYREMSIKLGDNISTADLDEELDRTYSALMNTGLFVSVILNYDTIRAYQGELNLKVTARETWYIYPVPVFSLADRNFNVWWTEQNRSLDRINLGVKLAYYNFTGRRDRLKLGFTTGYTQRYELGYRLPYINKAGSIGLEFSGTYERRREQNYQTFNNEQLFYRDDEQFNYRRLRLVASGSYRRALYVSHRLDVEYRSAEIADTIARFLNPEFFGNGGAEQKFFRARYQFRNDRRDVRNYPWDGSYLNLELVKDGFGILGERDGLTFSGSYSRFIPFGKKYSFNAGVSAKYSLIRSQQPFLENRAIGFGDNGLVGYQFYVVDGLDMVIWRLGVRRELFRAGINLGRLAFIPAFRYIPIRVLLATQLNQGISNSPFAEESNDLTNNLLTGMAAGLDVVLYFDMVVGVQYNRNHLGEDGVFLNLALKF